jgi:hypothetical protein
LQQLGGAISSSNLTFIDFACICGHPKRFIEHLLENVVIPIELEGGTGIVDLHWESFSQICSTDSDGHRKLRRFTLTKYESQAIRLRLANLGQKKVTGGVEFVKGNRRSHRSKINAQG